MEVIELNHWFVADNELSISLMRYFVKINICQNNKYMTGMQSALWYNIHV